MATHHGKTGIYFPARLGVDTDAYDYRWKTPGGDVYYTNNENDNPNTFLHQTGYERTQVRKGRNE